MSTTIDYFPTLTHQYATKFNPAFPYKAGSIVRAVNETTEEWAAFKIIKDAAANAILTDDDVSEYAVLLPKLPIPNPSRPFKEGTKSNTLIYTGDSGHEQRREKSPPKRTFEVTWAALTLDQYVTLRDFYMYVLNSKPFLWMHPIEKTQILVRFANEVFQGENFGHGPKGPIYKLQLSLLEVWS